MKGVTLDFSRPDKPTDNAFIESFNGKFRAEWRLLGRFTSQFMLWPNADCSDISFELHKGGSPLYYDKCNRPFEGKSDGGSTMIATKE
jgi:transposase InsO family protein